MKSTASLHVALAALLLAASTASASAVDDPAPRVSESKYYATDGRSGAEPDRVSTDEHLASEKGRRSVAQQSGAEIQGKDRSLAAVGSDLANIDFWFYSADAEMFADDDRDGYFHGIDLLFDVDTVFLRAEVYAVVYLSRDGGPWLEYAETEDFVIHGTSANDEFNVVTELLSGYPAGDYDVLIELFDAFDHTFLADVGPAESPALGFLPLEDAERDAPIVESRTVVVNSTSGGGATDATTLAALFLLTAGVMLARRRKPALQSNDG